MKTRTVQTTMSWILTAHIFIAIIAYEWLPASFRGSWIFIFLLLIAGSFLTVGWALILGLVTFVAVAVYFLLDLANQTYIERQLLLLFIIPITPVLLSAIRHNLQSSLDNFQSVEVYQQKIQYDVLPLSALDNVKTELNKMLEKALIPQYEIFQILITNHSLIEDMLGADVWKNTQNQIIEKLNCPSNEISFHFINQELSEIYSIIIRDSKQQEYPSFIQNLKDIATLRLNIKQEIIHSSSVNQMISGER